jgi:hypothetical protein
MKKLMLSLVVFTISVVSLVAFAQAAPPAGAVPASWLTEVGHFIAIASGWNSLLAGVQILLHKLSTPAAKAVGQAAGQAALTAAAAAATAAATQAAAPEITAAQNVAALGLALTKVLAANPDVPAASPTVATVAPVAAK